MSGARVLFLGTGEIAIPAFRMMIDREVPPLALVTQPDRPAGRKRQLNPPPIKEVALAAGVAVIQPEQIRDPAVLDELRALKPDLIVVMAYGQILPQALIGMAPLGCVNLHASLLPKYRGAACIQAAIDAGDELTGMTLMDVVRELDAGDVIMRRETRIFPEDTAGRIHDRLAVVGAELLAEALPGLLDGSLPRTPQAELGESSHVPKLDREDGRIDWSWPARRIERRLRAYDPWPGTWTVFDDGAGERRLKVFPGAMAVAGKAPSGEVSLVDGAVVVACGEGALRLGEVQPDGGRRMLADAWVRGLRDGGMPRLH